MVEPLVGLHGACSGRGLGREGDRDWVGQDERGGRSGGGFGAGCFAPAGIFVW